MIDLLRNDLQKIILVYLAVMFVCVLRMVGNCLLGLSCPHVPDTLKHS